MFKIITRKKVILIFLILSLIQSNLWIILLKTKWFQWTSYVQTLYFSLPFIFIAMVVSSGQVNGSAWFGMKLLY